VRLDPQVVQESRTLFLAGTTPSRLIKYIISRHATEEKLYSLIQFYFREAFLTPLLRASSELMLNDSQGMSLAFLNENLVHQMLLNRQEWDTEHSPDSHGTNWFDGLHPRSDADLINNVKPELIPELSKSWGLMDEEAKRYIQRAFGNAQALHERVVLLSRLAEQLQQQVNALLEERRQDESETPLVHLPQK
jgi:hypothetical protein